MFAMRKLSSFLVAMTFVLSAAPHGASASNLGSFNDSLLRVELESVFGTIENNYGPLIYKEERFGFSWNQVKADYREKLAEAQTTQEVYFMYSELLNVLQDSHVSIRIPSNFQRSLPLQFAYVEGKTIVVYINAEDYPDDVTLPEIGDELVLLDGKSPDQLRREYSRYSSAGNELTNKTLLTLFLTAQSEGSGFLFGDQDVSVLELKKASTGETYQVELKWETEGTRLIGRPLNDIEAPKKRLLALRPTLSTASSNMLAKKAFDNVHDQLKHILKMQSRMINLESGIKNVANLQIEMQEEDGDEERGKLTELGAKDPFFALPKDFEPIDVPLLLKPVNAFLSPLSAGSFKRNGKTIGFLRIPSYMPAELFSSYVTLQYYLKWLEENTDVLFIDQSNNPGGYVAYSDWIVQGLVGNTSADRHMKFAVRPTASFLNMFAHTIEQVRKLEENPELSGPAKDAAKAIAKKFLPQMEQDYKRVHDAYQAGSFFSEPVSLYLFSDYAAEMIRSLPDSLANGNAFIEKAISYGSSWFLGFDLRESHTYSKPIYMYINELDFSGGDATPAALQDYGRVTLIGTNTAGAGGSVAMFTNSVQLPFVYSLTNSLMVRPGDVLVENVGVQPDIPFELTVEDYKNGFETTFDRLLEAAGL